MKKKIVSLSLALVLVFACTICLSACGNREVWTPPKRVSLNLPDKVHVEYINDRISGDALLPGYCVLVKEGDQYYVKAPTTYSSNRLEVFEKINLTNAVVFDKPQYSQGYISARWNDYNNTWVSAADDSYTSPNAPEWHANDQNNHVYYTGIAFLDSGYGDINHTYENGVADSNGYKHTATQKDNETLTIGSNQVECIVWEYEAYFSEDNWSKEKFWLDADTGIMLKRTSVLPSSQNQSLDAAENIGLKATYFSKTETMQDYLTSIDRWPAPDFSDYR